MKKIGIMTTGGDCSGLNTAIHRIMRGASRRGWRVFGILDGTDGLCITPPAAIELNEMLLPIENARLAGSFLHNGRANALNFETAAETGRVDKFRRMLRKSLKDLALDALILIGGNGSISLAWANRDIYRDLQLICIPKTIDLDIPLTTRTIGFDSAVQQLTAFCDRILRPVDANRTQSSPLVRGSGDGPRLWAIGTTCRHCRRCICDFNPRN